MNSKLSLTSERDMERDFIALGALELSLDDITAARMRLERFTDLTPAQALNRLRMKMESLRDINLISECKKAIAELSVLKAGRCRPLITARVRALNTPRGRAVHVPVNDAPTPGKYAAWMESFDCGHMTPRRDGGI